MIQLNLLPDVKTKYIKAQRSKRTVVTAAVIISGSALAIVVLLASVVYGAQKLQLSILDNEIKEKTAELKKIDGLNKILTVQNQLNALQGLHDDKPVATRIFTFLPQVTPNDVSISNYDISFEESTMTITGTAKDLVAVNRYVDTLKFTNYVASGENEQQKAFEKVVLSSFSSTDDSTSYTITLAFDPVLFDGQYQNVDLIVPQIVTTRSETERPLFVEQQNTDEGEN